MGGAALKTRIKRHMYKVHPYHVTAQPGEEFPHVLMGWLFRCRKSRILSPVGGKFPHLRTILRPRGHDTERLSLKSQIAQPGCSCLTTQTSLRVQNPAQ